MKRNIMAMFAKALMADGTEFTPELWNALVDQAQVSPDGEIKFTFKSGAEITV